jgi:hypothetical protein
MGRSRTGFAEDVVNGLWKGEKMKHIPGNAEYSISGRYHRQEISFLNWILAGCPNEPYVEPIGYSIQGLCTKIRVNFGIKEESQEMRILRELWAKATGFWFYLTPDSNWNTGYPNSEDFERHIDWVPQPDRKGIK